MRIAPFATAVCLALLLTACGQKGPLVLPDAQRPHKKIGVSKPAEQPAPPKPVRD